MLSSSPSSRTDACTFSLHWGMVAALIISLLSGLRIALDYNGSAIGSSASGLGWLLFQGEVITWHVWSSWSLTFIAVAYAVFLWWSKESVRVKWDKSVSARLAQGWRSGRFWSNLSAWFAVNVVIYQLAFLMIAMMALTGWMLYAGVDLGLGYDNLSLIHGIIAYGFVLYIIIHILAQLKTGTFWKIFRPRLQYTLAAVVALTLSAATVGAAYVFDRNMFDELAIAQISEPPTLDGSGDDEAWTHAAATTVMTHRGENLEDGDVPVEIAAVHDGERMYLKFRWPDPERSQKHLPLVKKEDGWHVLQSEFEINDEDEYYEDKFAVAIAHVPDLGSGTVHLGQNLISGPHRPTNRGLHYTDDGSLVDMWHWKSVRTGGMSPSLMDDNHFGPPKPSEKPGKRYTGGYSQDPKEEGGYTLNWDKTDESKPLNETTVVPKVLPADPSLLDQINPVDLDPAVGDEGRWYFKADETVPYDPGLDDFPVGTVMPSVVIEASFTGDRGDVRAGANWKDGYWTLEASRVLDTGSDYDVAVQHDEDAYLWVSVFNHNQTRHSQHLHPLSLQLQ